MARVTGIEYPALIRNICELALARSKELPPPNEWMLAQNLSGITAVPPELDLFTTGLN